MLMIKLSISFGKFSRSNIDDIKNCDASRQFRRISSISISSDDENKIQTGFYF